MRRILFFLVSFFSPAIFCHSFTADCLAVIRDLSHMDDDGQKIIRRYFPKADLEIIANLFGRYQDVKNELKKNDISPKERVALSAEKKMLEPLIGEYSKFLGLIKERQDLQGILVGGKRDATVDSLLRDPDIMVEFETAVSNLEKAYTAFKSDQKRREKILPFSKNNKAQKAFESLPKAVREVVLNKLQIAKENPGAGEKLVNFPNQIRFIKFTVDSTHYRICYVINKDQTIAVEKIGPRENFYDDLDYLRR